ncbi:MAG: WD40/YVTN/BNR-like repeat-containing protein, partial [Planctomycetota bacterium]
MDGMLLYTLVAIASVLAAQQPTGFIGGGAGFGVQGGFGEESLPASEPSSRPDSSYDRDSRYRAGSGNPGATPAQPQPESPKKLPPSGLKFDPMTTVEMRGDARLCEVVFVDAECGWAVGDRGVIWHTEDGGRRWQLQESGIGASLRSVTFIDRQTGWVGGGSTHPYAHSSFAVVLATRDGGRSWKQVPAPLPAVRRLRMFDTRRGWALCAPSSRFPWPVFVTEDGGQTWAPLVGGAQGDWLAAELTAPASGALAGRMGAAAAIRQQRVELLGAAFGLRALRDLRLLPPTGGWLVGDGGLLMATTDLGASWQSPPAPLPQEFADQFDLRTVTAVGDRVWAAGDPGTRVLHSPDGGRSWLAATTNSRAPIEDLCFVDTLHGWAVGALGTILATDDGGRTWRRQRCGGTRAALLGVYAEAEQVPLELIARLSGNEGYLAAVATLCRRDVETPPRGTIHLEERLQEAVVHSGGSESSIAWRFPLRQSGLTLSTEQILDTWNRATDGRGIAELRAYLVARIRLW